MRKTVGILGCGALGSAVARGICEALAEDYVLMGVADENSGDAEILAEQTGCRAFANVQQLLEAHPCYLVEAASGGAVRQWGQAALAQGCHLVLLSVGALADKALYNELTQSARRAGRKIYLPSGAIGGLDVLRTMALMEKDMDVRVVNCKPPAGLAGAPGLMRPLTGEKEEQVFSGTAWEAIQRFPKNVNVAVAAALAGAGLEGTQVEIRSVPGLTRNVHRIHADGRTVSVVLETASAPDPANPRSSTLAAWSVVALLRNLASPIQF